MAEIELLVDEEDGRGGVECACEEGQHEAGLLREGVGELERGDVGERSAESHARVADEERVEESPGQDGLGVDEQGRGQQQEACADEATDTGAVRVQGSANHQCRDVCEGCTDREHHVELQVLLRALGDEPLRVQLVCGHRSQRRKQLHQDAWCSRAGGAGEGHVGLVRHHTHVFVDALVDERWLEGGKPEDWACAEETPQDGTGNLDVPFAFGGFEEVHGGGDCALDGARNQVGTVQEEPA